MKISTNLQTSLKVSTILHGFCKCGKFSTFCRYSPRVETLKGGGWHTVHTAQCAAEGRELPRGNGFCLQWPGLLHGWMGKDSLTRSEMRGRIFLLQEFTVIFSKNRPLADSFIKSRCPSVLSLFAWYILRPILPPLPEVGCPNFLEIQNPWGNVLERSGLRFEHFC